MTLPHSGLILVVALLASMVCHSQRLAAAADIDALIEAERQRQRIPGVAVLVVRDGETVVQRGYGLANVEHQVPVIAETIFQSGSMGKQFTATAVMMLVEDGKIALEDPVKKYLTDAPVAWDAITIRHLLSHTAGLGDYPPAFNFRRDHSEDKLLEVIYESKLHFAPGEGWRYSNLGYMTLGVLLHRVTGSFYGDFLRERIFTPLGMKTARVISEADIIPHRAAGYRLIKGELKNQEWVAPSLNTTADGSLYLTVRDLAGWDAGLRGDKLLKRESLDQMWTPVKLKNGEPNSGKYGFGWMCHDVKGHKVVEHGGAWQGFTTHIARYLDDGLTVAVLTNLAAESGANPARIGRIAAGCFVSELAPASLAPIDDPEPEVTRLVRTQLEKLARGEADANDFVGPARQAIFPDRVAEVKAGLTSLGQLKDLNLLVRKLEGQDRICRYRARFADGPTLVLVVRLDAEKKVEEFDLEGE